MTPQEKAKELVDKYWRKYPTFSISKGVAKDYALIAVEGILEILPNEIFGMNEGLYCGSSDSFIKKYWYQVKEEIEKL